MNERIKQTKIYIGKHFRLFKNEKGWKVIIFAAVVSFLVSSVTKGIMFGDDVNTKMGFFTLISACIWIGIFNSIQNICKERDIVKREHRTGLHITSYVASHLIYQGAICLVEALMIVIISGIMIGYPSENALFISTYAEYFITYFLVTYAADVLALAISSIVKSTTTAMTIMPFILIFQLLFAGVLFSLSGSMETVANFTISKWGLQASGISCDYNNLEKLEQKEMRYQLKKIAKSKNYKMTEEELDEVIKEAYEDTDTYNATYEYSLSNLMGNWSALLIHTAIYAIISVAALELVDRDKR